MINRRGLQNDTVSFIGFWMTIEGKSFLKVFYNLIKEFEGRTATIIDISSVTNYLKNIKHAKDKFSNNCLMLEYLNIG